MLQPGTWSTSSKSGTRWRDAEPRAAAACALDRVGALWKEMLA